MLKLAAFDFDGTMADSVDFCLAVFEETFRKYMGDDAPPMEDVYQNFGMNEAGILRYYMGGVNPEAEEYFYELHRTKHPEMCPEAYPGIVPLLDFLASKDLDLIVLTGRTEETCNISMDYLKLRPYFSGFQTGSPERNDKAAQLRKLMQDHHLDADELVYVGDAVSDVRACREAGVGCLSAAWAKSARIDELNRINPGLVFTAVEDMLEYFKKALAAE